MVIYLVSPLSLWLSWLTLAVFTAFFVIKGNREFLLYAATLAILILLVQGSDRRLRYPAGVLWCFWLWLIMHMCGGFVHLNGVRLYDIRLLPLANPRTPKALRCSRSTRPLPPLKKPEPCAAPMPRALPGAMPSKCCWSGWTR